MDGVDCLFAYWHPRVKVESQMVVAYGPGDLEVGSAPIGRPFAVGWVDCGSVLLDQPEVVGAVPLTELDALKGSIGEHIVRLVAQGWGDAPSEVLGWFSSFCPIKAFVPGSYVVVGGFGDFRLLDEWSGLSFDVLSQSGDKLEVEWRTSSWREPIGQTARLSREQALSLFMSSLPRARTN